MKAVLVTFVYPGVELFLADLLTSIAAQTNKDFDLILFNDGIDETQLRKIVAKFVGSYVVKIVASYGEPPKIRQRAISYLQVEGYDYAIWVDADDFIESNRVEVTLRELKRFDIVINDLHIVDASGSLIECHYLSNRIKANQLVSYKDIERLNFIGFSNSAVNLNKINFEIIIPNNIIAVDWFLYYVLLKNKLTAVFINETATSYRQHENNTVGIKKISRELLRSEIRVKARHYAALVAIGEPFHELSDFYAKLLHDSSSLEKKLRDILNLKDYF